MSNSPYVDYNILSKKHSGRRTEKVQAFVIHHMMAVWTGKRCAEYFTYETEREASANYCIGYDGDVAMNVEEVNRAWTSSSYWADQRAITFELSNSKMGYPWVVSDRTIQKLIMMLAELHQRYGLRASYTGDTNGTLWRHDWFAKTECPGEYLGSKLKYIAEEVNKILDGKVKQENKENTGGEIIMIGRFKVNDNIYVYDEPKVKPGKHVAKYTTGEELNFDKVVFKNGYVWLSYVSYTEERRYIPIAPLSENVWGLFI